MAAEGPIGRLREDDEARGVVGLVLHVLGQDLETVDLGRKARGERRPRRILELRDLTRADPAVSPDTWALSPSVRMILRHCPSA